MEPLATEPLVVLARASPIVGELLGEKRIVVGHSATGYASGPRRMSAPTRGIERHPRSLTDRRAKSARKGAARSSGPLGCRRGVTAPPAGGLVGVWGSAAECRGRAPCTRRRAYVPTQPGARHRRPVPGRPARGSQFSRRPGSREDRTRGRENRPSAVHQARIGVRLTPWGPLGGGFLRFHATHDSKRRDDQARIRGSTQKSSTWKRLVLPPATNVNRTCCHPVVLYGWMFIGFDGVHDV